MAEEDKVREFSEYRANGTKDGGIPRDNLYGFFGLMSTFISVEFIQC